MAAPANPVGTMPSLASPAEDAPYKEIIAQIGHAEGNMFGSSYGTTGEIEPGSEIGKAIAGIGRRGAEGLRNTARTAKEMTRRLSGRAGANIQSGIYGSERENAILGFNQREAGIRANTKEAIERQEERARTKWEADQFARSAAIRKAGERYANYVARNPQAPVVTPPPTAVQQGYPASSNPRVNPNFGGGNMGGPTPVGGFGTPGNIGVIQAGGVRAGRPTFGPPPRPRRR